MLSDWSILSRLANSSSDWSIAFTGSKRKEIYKYEAPWTVYAMNWSMRPDKRFRLAVGSFVEVTATADKDDHDDDDDENDDDNDLCDDELEYLILSIV